MQSGSSHGGYTFSQVPKVEIPRSKFNRSHGHKTTFDADYLIPVLVDEVLPGDTFRVQMSILARLATPVAPIMDNLFLDVFFFYVPNRLLWANFKRFMGEQDNPSDSISYVMPTVTLTNPSVGSLWDYFGIPTGTFNVTVNALMHRAYAKIWNEWFRDENLQTSQAFDFGDGPDAMGNYALYKRGKRHDYFTSCLPWTQKGTAATIPLGTTAPVIPSTAAAGAGGSAGIPFFMWNTNPSTNMSLQANTTNTVILSATNSSGTTPNTLKWSTNAWNAASTGLMADLSSATSATINTLRQAFQIQKLLEKDARGGTRYVEILKSHFGVVSPDFRLQRSEFLGGGTVQVNVNPVVQTSSTASEPNPKGSLAAYGVAAHGGIGFTKSFTEHGVILGLVCARGEISYQQGLHKMWTRSTRYDYYWPSFAHLGEQAVLNSEIYYQGIPGTGATQDSGVFGYQERWAEYRYYPSKITGKFRSTYATPLDTWHLAEKFTSLPTLGATFIQQNTPIARVLAVPSQPHFIFDSYTMMECTRPMPAYSVPGLIDHF